MKRLDDHPRGKQITIDFEGETLTAFEGEPLAAALLAAGQNVFSRSSKYHRPRGPFCFSGGCSNCLMRVNGVPNVCTCRAPAQSGMRIERQNAFPSAKFDVYGAADFLFPRGLDHHELLTGVPLAQKALVGVVRHLAGLGTLPDREAPPRAAMELVREKIVIVGAGASGLAAARAISERGLPFLLVERESYLGGRLAHGPATSEAGNEAPPGGRTLLSTTALGLFDDEKGWFLAAECEGRLLRIEAERYLLAMGGQSQQLAFANNDLPGVIAARAASLLLRRHGILPGEHAVLVGEGDEFDALAELFEKQGGKIAAIVDLHGQSRHPKAVHGEPLEAHGRTKLSALTVKLAGGGTRKIDCDAIFVCLPPSPSYELARQAGAIVHYDETASVFVVQADPNGRTAHKQLFVAGDLTGPKSVQAAAEAGRRAALAIAPEVSP